MPASCWSVSFCVCACAPRPIRHLGDAVFSCQLLVLSRKKKKERIQKPSAFSCQFSVISGNKEEPANIDAFRGSSLVGKPAGRESGFATEARRAQRRSRFRQKRLSSRSSAFVSVTSP